MLNNENTQNSSIIEKINKELKKFWKENQEKHPDICKYLELSGIVTIKGGVPTLILAGGIAAGAIGNLVPFFGILFGLVIVGGIWKYKEKLDKKYKEKLEEFCNKIDTIVKSDLQKQQITEESLSDILKKHKLKIEECRKRFFEDKASDLELVTKNLKVIFNDKVEIKLIEKETFYPEAVNAMEPQPSTSGVKQKSSTLQ